MSSEHFQRIDQDLACENCDYNLRGLMENDRCPECGQEIPVITEQTDEEIEAYFRRRAESQASRCGCSADAFLIIRDAVRLAETRLNPSTLPSPFSALNRWRSPDARTVCLALQETAAEYFESEEEALELLAEWGIHGSDDVGKIVHAVIREEYQKHPMTSALRDFERLFTLDNFFTFAD